LTAVFSLPEYLVCDSHFYYYSIVGNRDSFILLAMINNNLIAAYL